MTTRPSLYLCFAILPEGVAIPYPNTGPCFLPTKVQTEGKDGKPMENTDDMN